MRFPKTLTLSVRRNGRREAVVRPQPFGQMRRHIRLVTTDKTDPMDVIFGKKSELCA